MKPGKGKHAHQSAPELFPYKWACAGFGETIAQKLKKLRQASCRFLYTAANMNASREMGSIKIKLGGRSIQRLPIAASLRHLTQSCSQAKRHVSQVPNFGIKMDIKAGNLKISLIQCWPPFYIFAAF